MGVQGHGEDVQTHGPHDGHARDSSATAGDEGTSEREDEGEEERTIPAVNRVEIEAEFAAVPDSNVQHFFVDADPSLPEAASEVVGFEADAAGEGSITQFLSLPTVAARVNRRSKDPIMDFSKSIMLTSDQYINAAAQLKEAKAASAREKEQARLEKEEKKRRRAIEREEERRAKEARAAEAAEARAQKLAEREEACALKESRAAKAAHARATRVADREHAQRLRAERAVAAAETRAQKEADRARQAIDALARATERAQGRQSPRRILHRESEEPLYEGSEGECDPWTLQSQISRPPYLVTTAPPVPGFVTHVSSTSHSAQQQPSLRRMQQWPDAQAHLHNFYNSQQAQGTTIMEHAQGLRCTERAPQSENAEQLVARTALPLTDELPASRRAPPPTRRAPSTNA